MLVSPGCYSFAWRQLSSLQPWHASLLTLDLCIQGVDADIQILSNQLYSRTLLACYILSAALANYSGVIHFPITASSRVEFFDSLRARFIQFLHRSLGAEPYDSFQAKATTLASAKQLSQQALALERLGLHFAHHAKAPCSAAATLCASQWHPQPATAFWPNSQSKPSGYA